VCSRRFLKSIHFRFGSPLAIRNGLVIVFLLCGLWGCSAPPAGSGVTPQATPPRIQPASGKGGLVGAVPEAGEIWPEMTLRIYAASYLGEEGKGIYVLETASAPKALLDAQGRFQINNIPPGRYVLVVGPSGGEALYVADTNNQLRIFTVGADEVQDLNDLRLAR